MKVLIALPCYDGMHPMFVSSLSMLYLELLNRRIQFGIMMMKDSLIPRSRNRIANQFLEEVQEMRKRGEEPWTDLLQLDTDINFDAAQLVERVLLSPHEVVGGTYPAKGLDWDAISYSFKNGADTSAARLAGTRYITNFNAKRHLEVRDGYRFVRMDLHVDSHGCIESRDTGTGLMRINVSALERLVDSYENDPARWMLYMPQFPITEEGEVGYDGVPELVGVHQGIYEDDMPGPDRGKKRYNFFGDFVDMPEPGHPHGRFLSEDYAFCRRIQWCGGKTHTAIVQSDHYGEFCYQGNLDAVLQPQKQGDTDPVPPALDPEAAA